VTRSNIQVSEVHVRLASARDRELGLLAFVSLTVAGGLRIDGLTVRRSLAGHTFVAFPHRVDGRGRERFYSKPIDDETKSAIESAVAAEMVRVQGESAAAKQGDPGELAGAESARQTRRGSAR